MKRPIVGKQGGPRVTDFGHGSPLRAIERRWRRRRRTRIELPALTTEEGVLLIELLERMTRALWRQHGGDIADYMGRVDPDTMYDWPGASQPDLARHERVTDPPGDDDF